VRCIANLLIDQQFFDSIAADIEGMRRVINWGTASPAASRGDGAWQPIVSTDSLPATAVDWKLEKPASKRVGRDCHHTASRVVSAGSMETMRVSEPHG
jgi:hypothetical protein